MKRRVEQSKMLDGDRDFSPFRMSSEAGIHLEARVQSTSTRAWIGGTLNEAASFLGRDSRVEKTLLEA